MLISQSSFLCSLLLQLATTIMVCAEIFIREIVFAFFAKFFSRKLFSQNSVSFSHFFSLNSFSRNNVKFNEKVCETNENYRFFSLLCFMRFSVFQKFQGCVSGVSGLCLKRFRVVTQEIQCCVSGVSGLCLKRFRVVFQEIQCCVSRDSVLCFKRFRVMFQEFQGVYQEFQGVFQKFQCCVFVSLVPNLPGLITKENLCLPKNVNRE